MVKQLQKEVARLEAELKSPDILPSSRLRALLREKDVKIEEVSIRNKDVKFLELEFYTEILLRI